MATADLSRARAWMRGVGLALGGVVLLAVAALLTPPVREWGLRRAVHPLTRELPGKIVLGEIHWPAPGRLDLRDVHWTLRGDTLLAFERCALQIDLAAFLRRDLHIASLQIDGVSLDLPAVTVNLPSPAPGSAVPRAAGARRGPLRAGSFPGAPSLAIDRATVHIRRARLDETHTIGAGMLQLSAELRRGRAPRLLLDRLSVSGDGEGWALDSLALDIDLEQGKIHGRADAALAPGYPVRLALESPHRDAFTLRLALGTTDLAAAAAGLRLEGEVLRRDGRPHELRFAGRLQLPDFADLTRLPFLAPALATWPPLVVPQIDLAGAVHFTPRPQAELQATLLATDWIQGGTARLAYTPERLALDTLALRIGDLRVDARGEISGGRAAAAATVEAVGTEWLRPFAERLPVLDSLAAVARVTVSGPVEAPALEATLQAGLRQGGLRIAPLAFHLHLPGDPATGPIMLDLSAQAADLALALEARIEREGERLTAYLPPIRVTATGAADGGRPAASPPVAMLQLDREQGTFSVQGLQLVGALGDLQISGEGGAGRASALRASLRWPEAPAALRPLLERAAPGGAAGADAAARWDSLRVHWRRDGPFGVEIEGAGRSGPAAVAATARASLRLPGPGTLGGLLPKTLDLRGWGPIAGVAVLQYDADSLGAAQVIACDLSETAWLDEARLQLRAGPSAAADRTQALHVDTLALALEGVRAGFRGERRSGLWAGDALVEIENPPLLRRLAPALAESLTLELRAEAAFVPAPAGQETTVALEGNLATPTMRVPRLTAELSWRADQLRAWVATPEGIITPALQLSRVRAEYSCSSPRRAVPGRWSLLAEGPRLALLHRAEIDGGQGWTVRTDTLAIVLDEQDLRTRGPFHLRYEPHARSLRIDRWLMEGTLGTLDVQGRLQPDSAGLTADLHLRLPPEPPLATLPVSLWPRDCAFALRVGGLEDLDASLRLAGLPYDATPLAVDVALACRPGNLHATLGIATAGATVARGELRVPCTLTLTPLGVTLGEEALTGRLQWDACPIPLRALAGGGQADGIGRALLTGALHLGGTSAEPAARGRVRVVFPDWPQLVDDTLHLEVQLAPAAGLPGPLADRGLIGIPSTSLDAARPGLQFALEIATGVRRWLRARGAYPLRVALHPAAPPAAPDTADAREIAFDLAIEDLAAGDLNHFLPPDVALAGVFSLHLAVHGPLANPTLDGRFKTAELSIMTADGSQGALRSDLRLSGTARQPRITGESEVLRGVLRIPEPPPNLHPVEGAALLWGEASPGTAAPAGSLAADRPTRGGSAPATPAATPEVSYDARLLIPSGLWIRGRGLEAELSGELQLVQLEGSPTIAGGLAVERGHLVFLGRPFVVEHGSATFYGDDEINPGLDLLLTTRVGETRIRIQVQGTVQAPELLLSSDPEMTEGDIMAFLVFGRPLDELNSDQMNLLQRRAAELMASYATAQLEARLSRQLGVDLVTIRRSQASDRHALVLGKYLSRRALLTYEQTLEERASFLINLEYFLTHNIKVDTVVGQAAQSGIEINWSREF